MTTLSHLSKMKTTDSIIGMEVETKGRKIGNVSNLLHDKYGRLDGVEVKTNDKSSALRIHYLQIDGVDEERTVMLVRLPG